MRLIDADKLILYLNDYALQEAPFRGERAEAYNAIKQCIEAVEEQPTAYDIDKVVRQLNLESVDSSIKESLGLLRAIKIVKAVGENDKSI